MAIRNRSRAENCAGSQRNFCLCSGACGIESGAIAYGFYAKDFYNKDNAFEQRIELESSPEQKSLCRSCHPTNRNTRNQLKEMNHLDAMWRYSQRAPRIGRVSRVTLRVKANNNEPVNVLGRVSAPTRQQLSSNLMPDYISGATSRFQLFLVPDLFRRQYHLDQP